MLRHKMNYTSSLKGQKGFTAVGWIVIITLVLFFTYLGMILTPPIIGGFTMDRILNALKEEPGITKKSKKQVWKLIENRMIINQVDNIKKNDFEIIITPEMTTVYLDYDDKVKVAGNVFILIERSKSVELFR